MDQSSASPAPTWETVLQGEKEQAYFQQALQFVKQARMAGKKIYPPAADVFNAFKFTPFAEVKIVILGQDPYHGPQQAHGLSFSVRPGVPKPPSLRNIFLELQTDLGIPVPKTGCLEPWARQGVLLLNTSLTVEAGKPQSHATIGWELFTDQVMRILSAQRAGLIFLLWGAPAQRKGKLIDSTRHTILTAAHPSPLSAHRGFLGCQHFSKANALLRQQNLEEINWQLT